MNKTKLEIVRFKNEDVITTSGICHYENGKYTHLVITNVDAINDKMSYKMIMNVDGELQSYLVLNDKLSTFKTLLGKTPNIDEVYHVIEGDQPIVIECDGNHDYLNNAINVN